MPEVWTGEGDPLVQHGQDERVQRNKERRSRRRTSMPLVAIASLCLLASVLAAEAQPPDATLTGHTASIAVGVGTSGGGHAHLAGASVSLPHRWAHRRCGGASAALR